MSLPEIAQQPNGAALKAVSIFPAWDGGGTTKIVPYIEAEGGSVRHAECRENTSDNFDVC